MNIKKKSCPKIGQSISLGFEGLMSQGVNLNVLSKDNKLKVKNLMLTESAVELLVLEYFAKKYGTYNSGQIGQAFKFAYATVDDKNDLIQVIDSTEEFLNITTEIQELGVDGIFKEADQKRLNEVLTLLGGKV